LCENLQLRWSLKQSCSPRLELSKGMWQATYTRENRVDSWLLVIGSQIANLTLDFSFGHNLCFRHPNGSCEPILDICVSIYFQWYKYFLNPIGFNPWNCSLKIWKSIKTPTLQVGVVLGVWGFIFSHSSTLPGI
jgi:hypothetical protein